MNARGDARATSDFDLAFEHDSDDATLAEFLNRIQETAGTLQDLDLVDFGSAPQELRAKILAEGLLLHG